MELPKDVIQGPILSNVFTNDQEEEEVKHALIKFANHAKRERWLIRWRAGLPFRAET